MGPRPWLEGLVPGGLHAGRDGVLWSLRLGHLHVGLVVGCGAWGLGGQRGSDRLCLPGHVAPEGRRPVPDFRPQALGLRASMQGPLRLQCSPRGEAPVLWDPVWVGRCPRLQPHGGRDTQCVVAWAHPAACVRGPFLGRVLSCGARLHRRGHRCNWGVGTGCHIQSPAPLVPHQPPALALVRTWGFVAPALLSPPQHCSVTGHVVGPQQMKC